VHYDSGIARLHMTTYHPHQFAERPMLTALCVRCVCLLQILPLEEGPHLLLVSTGNLHRLEMRHQRNKRPQPKRRRSSRIRASRPPAQARPARAAALRIGAHGGTRGATSERRRGAPPRSARRSPSHVHHAHKGLWRPLLCAPRAVRDAGNQRHASHRGKRPESPVSDSESFATYGADAQRPGPHPL
jgi:hypothetical protein